MKLLYLRYNRMMTTVYQQYVSTNQLVRKKTMLFISYKTKIFFLKPHGFPTLKDVEEWIPYSENMYFY